MKGIQGAIVILIWRFYIIGKAKRWVSAARAGNDRPMSSSGLLEAGIEILREERRIIDYFQHTTSIFMLLSRGFDFPK